MESERKRHKMSSYQETHKLELFPGSSVTLALFRDVKNVADLKKAVTEGKIDATLLSPKLIINPFQLLVATNKALHNKTHNKMKTRNVNSEVLFCLSPTNNISESFRRFGVSVEDTGIVITIIDDTDDGQKLRNIADMIDGDMAPMDQLESCADIPAMKKLYKLTEAELSTGTLLDAVVCRMALKDVS